MKEHPRSWNQGWFDSIRANDYIAKSFCLNIQLFCALIFLVLIPIPIMVGQERIPLYSEPTAPLSSPSSEDVKYIQTKQGRIFIPNQPISDEPISVTAAFGWKGDDLDDQEVYILQGDCQVTQGADKVTGSRAVLWVHNREKLGTAVVREVTIYLEKESKSSPLEIEINSSFVDARTNDMAWLGTFRTFAPLHLYLAKPGSNQLDPEAIFYRGTQMRQQDREEQHVPLYVPQTSRIDETIGNIGNLSGGELKFRRIRILPRHDYDMTITMESLATDTSVKQFTISSGITVVIEGISAGGKIVSEVVDISADRAVIWARGIDQITTGKENYQDKDLDLEIFLNGDIIFREGENIVYAKNMYYDAKNRIGLIRDAEMVVPIPSNPGGYFRLKAEEIIQRGPTALSAKSTWLTTSMMGEPSYRLQSEKLTAESKETPLFDAATGAPLIDPETGRQATKKDQYLIAENNVVALGSLPVLYWPWMATDVREQTLYLRNAKFGNDSIFGTQIQTTWNPYQIFGYKNRPDGTDWDISLDWLSKRGFGHGTSFVYHRESVFGCPLPAIGYADYYGIYDNGVDNLGLDRRNVTFDHPYRYRGLWKHRQMLGPLGPCGDGWMLTAQFGKSSDRNFLPQYFEDEWFNGPNPETSLEIKKTVENNSLGARIDYRLDDFYTQTNRLPQIDHFLMGKSLFSNRFVWYEHTKLGYNQFRTATAPYDQTDKNLFRYLDWELANESMSNNPNAPNTQTMSADSLNFSTRHELDLPLAMGPVKVVPYGLGEYAYWGTGMNEKNLSRWYGRAGVRLDIPLWKVDSDVTSPTWYLNGLAHKMNFVVDASYSSVSKSMEDLIFYDPLDDWQVEDFRRRYAVTTFGGSGVIGFGDSIPVQFDERYYALRHGGLAGSVASPSTEIADDLTLVRMDWLNRWQTKRGPVGKRHTIDWITFNTGFNLYPKKEENFDQVIGLVDYDFRWHVGDRFSVLSSGLYDFFGEGQRITRLGVMTKKPELASLYFGVDRLVGPINSTYLNASLNYRMSHKWGMSLGTSYDIALGENVGQSASVSRVGESFIFTLSGNINTSKDNWGLNLSVIPVFLLDKKKKEDAILNGSAL